MNSNQTVQTIGRVAPPLLLIVLAGLAIKSLFLGEKKKTETAPASAPKNIPVIIPPVSVAATPKVSATIPVVPISEIFPRNSTPQKRRVVLRKDLARIFQNGARSLYRIDAVAELQKLGFGKTAAYESLSPDGKFASWLKIAPDGIISWQK